MAYSEEFWTWVYGHIGENPYDLRLRWVGKYPWIADAIMQVECRQRTAKKLPEELKCRTFRFPTLLSSEQSTSDELAAFHASLLPSGLKVLDMTCGLGIDVLHMARHGECVTALDIDECLVDALRCNAEALGLSDKVTAVCADSTEFIAKAGVAFDAVFIDPARRGAGGERVFNLADCRPDVTALLDEVFRVAPTLIVKASPMLDLTQTLRDLPGTKALYVVGSNTECKELVAVVERDRREGTVPSINIWTPSYAFSFTADEERGSDARYCVPQADGYLYEPSEVTMKAAPWRTLCVRFGMGMLHPNSHLYCSESQIDGFPGDCWHIDRVIPFASSELKRFARQYPKINVAVRNFGWTADKLRDKLRVKDGGDLRMIATTLQGGDKVMLVLSKKC